MEAGKEGIGKVDAEFQSYSLVATVVEDRCWVSD